MRTPPGISKRSRRLFEYRYLRHRSGHRDDLLSPVIRHQEIRSGAHLGGVLGNLSKLEMRNSPIDADIAHAIKESSLFAIPAPGSKQLANSIAFLSFPCPAARVEQELLDQGTMGRKLFRAKISKGKVTDKVSRGGIFHEFGDRFFGQLVR